MEILNYWLELIIKNSFITAIESGSLLCLKWYVAIYLVKNWKISNIYLYIYILICYQIENIEISNHGQLTTRLYQYILFMISLACPLRHCLLTCDFKKKHWKNPNILYNFRKWNNFLKTFVKISSQSSTSRLKRAKRIIKKSLIL